MVLPEATAQHWQVGHLIGRVRAYVAVWKTEGQELADSSAIEQQRRALQQAAASAEEALAAARETKLSIGPTWRIDGEASGNVVEDQAAAAQAEAAAQAIAAAQAVHD